MFNYLSVYTVWVPMYKYLHGCGVCKLKIFLSPNRFRKNQVFRENIWKFKNPRNVPLGIDVENMHAKFHRNRMMGSGSKIGGTEMSREQQQEQQREKLLLHAKYADFKQSP